MLPGRTFGVLISWKPSESLPLPEQFPSGGGVAVGDVPPRTLVVANEADVVDGEGSGGGEDHVVGGDSKGVGVVGDSCIRDQVSSLTTPERRRRIAHGDNIKGLGDCGDVMGACNGVVGDQASSWLSRLSPCLDKEGDGEDIQLQEVSRSDSSTSIER